MARGSASDPIVDTRARVRWRARFDSSLETSGPLRWRGCADWCVTKATRPTYRRRAHCARAVGIAIPDATDVGAQGSRSRQREGTLDVTATTADGVRGRAHSQTLRQVSLGLLMARGSASDPIVDTCARVRWRARFDFGLGRREWMLRLGS